MGSDDIGHCVCNNYNNDNYNNNNYYYCYYCYNYSIGIL